VTVMPCSIAALSAQMLKGVSVCLALITERPSEDGP
jgi:hypothetical protein